MTSSMTCPIHTTALNRVRVSTIFPLRRVRASAVESGSSSFVNRTETAWLISKQPRPIACSSCNSNGHIECQWCAGTGFFVLGDNMLCQVPSKSTTCVICTGKGSMRCSDCKGTGFRAKWLGQPPVSQHVSSCNSTGSHYAQAANLFNLMSQTFGPVIKLARAGEIGFRKVWDVASGRN